MDNPIFFMMVGLPGSGKSVKAKELAERFNANIHSSDEIREELFNDVNCQDKNGKVFEVLHKRVVADIQAGKNTVYDATNINYKRRREFLQKLSKFECQKVCIFMVTPFEVCAKRNQLRERVVPYDVLVRMYKTFWVPYYYEGWDHIALVYPEDFVCFDTKELFNGENGLNFINQDNPHHTYTVGHHCLAAYGCVETDSKELLEATLLHDIGKPFTKSFVNSKGETTEIAHYYEHHHVSAYDSFFYSDPALNRLYVANVIQWHMRPFELEKVPNPDRAMDKFKSLVGEQLYEDVMLLHQADIKAK